MADAFIDKKRFDRAMSCLKNSIENIQIGSGELGQITFWSDNNVPTGDDMLFWDNVEKRLGINTSSINATLHVTGSGTTAATTAVQVDNANGAKKFAVLDDGTVEIGRNDTYSTVQSSPLQGSMAIIKPADANSLGLVLDIPQDGFFALNNTLVSGNSVPRGMNSIDLQINNVGATGYGSVVLGSGSATASGSVVVGSGTASGNRAAVFGLGIASGEGSLVLGAPFPFGSNVVAQGSYSAVLHSYYATASGTRSMTIGGEYMQSSALNAIALGGSLTSATLPGQIITNGSGIQGQGSWPNNTNACATFNVRMARQIYINSGAPLSYELWVNGAINSRAVLDSRATWNARLDVVATVGHDGSGGGYLVGQSWAASYQFVIRRSISDAVALLGTVDTVMSPKFDPSMNGCGVVITADNVNKAAVINFTIPSNTDIAALINVVATLYVTQTRSISYY